MNTGTQDGDQILNLPLGRSVLESFNSASPPHEGREYDATSRNSQGMGRVNDGKCAVMGSFFKKLDTYILSCE